MIRERVCASGSSRRCSARKVRRRRPRAVFPEMRALSGWIYFLHAAPLYAFTMLEKEGSFQQLRQAFQLGRQTGVLHTGQTGDPPQVGAVGFSPAAPRAEQTPMALDSGTDAGGGVSAAKLHKRKPKTLPEGGKRPPVHDNRFTLLVNMI